MDHEKYLISLTSVVAQYLTAIDAVMKQPSTVERGKVIARLSNSLEMANDQAMRFGLDYGWKKIGNIKKSDVLLVHIPPMRKRGHIKSCAT